MNHDSRIIRFTVHFYSGSKKQKGIGEINCLSTYLEKYGISSIRKIIFDFIRPPHFPYQCHNISLCNLGNTFRVQFYHYYNSFNQLVILHPDARYSDYTDLIKMIQSHVSLTSLLEPYIIPPIIL